MICNPCKTETRRVKFDSFEYDYCDNCKQEIVAGYPPVSRLVTNAIDPASNGVYRVKVHFRVGDPVTWVGSPFSDLHVMRTHDDGACDLIQAQYYFIRSTPDHTVVPAEELNLDRSRGSFVKYPAAPKAKAAPKSPYPLPAVFAGNITGTRYRITTFDGTFYYGTHPNGKPAKLLPDTVTYEGSQHAGVSSP